MEAGFSLDLGLNHHRSSRISRKGRLVVRNKGISNYTDKKEKKIFLIYQEILKVAVAKSYMRKGFLIYVEMRKFLVIYEEPLVTIYEFA
jgi:hypothetical protein